MVHGPRIGLGLLLLVSSCRDTFRYDSHAYESEADSSQFVITEEEAQAILERLKAKIEAGENLDGTLLTLIKIARARLTQQHPRAEFRLRSDLRKALETKYLLYRDLVPFALDSHGFVPGCDGLLFTSLLVAGGRRSPLHRAESDTEPGRWYRDAAQECYAKGESASTISRDMMQGLAIALWYEGDRASVERIIDYSHAHNGVIGEAINDDELYGRAFMSPQLIGIFHEVNFKLGGPDSDLRGYIPDFSKNLKGFEAHLQTLRILLRGALYGGLLSEDLAVMRSQLAKNPHNALFQAVISAYTDGNMDAAAEMLLDQTLFPADRLPTSSDRCEPYLWQRDEDSADWHPCPEKTEVHPAADYLFAAHYILGGFRFSP